MRSRYITVGLVLVLLVFTGSVVAAPYVRQAVFQRIFDGTNYFGLGNHFSIKLSTMSADGEVVAFYGSNTSSPYQSKLFIHAFDSTAAPVEVTLPAQVGNFNTTAGMTSNADGSRIFFIADDLTEAYYYLFCMVNGATGQVTVLGREQYEEPQDIATDAAGEYLYYNESDTGDSGDLWRIRAVAGSVPEQVIQANALAHPSGGAGRFVDQFDVSDDGNTIAFFVNGRQLPDDSWERTNRELFVKSGSGITYLTDNDQNDKDDLRISGDGSTIIYSGDLGTWDWMVTTPQSGVNGQVRIEEGYQNAGDRPDLTADGEMFFGRSCPVGVSDCPGYLIRTDGTGRLMMETQYTKGFRVTGTAEGLHLSGDGRRVLFKSLGTYGGFNTIVNYLYTGEFNTPSWTPPWSDQVPVVSSISYPAPPFVAKDESFEVVITVTDPQGVADVETVTKTMLFSDGYKDASSAGPVRVYNPVDESPGIYASQGYPGTAWPDRADAMDPITMRFAVMDQDGNLAYADKEIRAGTASCSSSAVETLEADDLIGGGGINCFAPTRIETAGVLDVTDGISLYLSAPLVNLSNGFKVSAGGKLLIQLH